jgi:hypothetical protein
MIRGIHTHSEGVGYATQKPEALLDRIVRRLLRWWRFADLRGGAIKVAGQKPTDRGVRTRRPLGAIKVAGQKPTDRAGVVADQAGDQRLLRPRAPAAPAETNETPAASRTMKPAGDDKPAGTRSGCSNLSTACKPSFEVRAHLACGRCAAMRRVRVKSTNSYSDRFGEAAFAIFAGWNHDRDDYPA